jgi:hypothetical protein
MTVTRRALLGAVGLAAGSAGLYRAITTLGYAQESTYQRRIPHEGEPNGRRILVRGAEFDHLRGHGLGFQSGVEVCFGLCVHYRFKIANIV